mmetsp:Transcript_30892/g.56200  ORF Transcript_30892/g.56200 Transcript_30892/m.56200 type:complete len:154 (-) Transcript_30892:17-478(-)
MGGISSTRSVYLVSMRCLESLRWFRTCMHEMHTVAATNNEEIRLDQLARSAQNGESRSHMNSHSMVDVTPATAPGPGSSINFPRLILSDRKLQLISVPFVWYSDFQIYASYVPCLIKALLTASSRLNEAKKTNGGGLALNLPCFDFEILFASL